MAAPASAWQERRPNIVLMMADDLGYECLGCNGGTSYKTPNLDALASTGIRFTHAYSQPLCTPTRLQLMTGQYNFRNWKAFGLMDPKEKTFGHLMSDVGYKTCMAGKWQFYSYNPPDYMPEWRSKGMLPKDAGFDEYCVWHAGHTEDKGSRYADPVVLENGKLSKLDGKYGEDVFASYIDGFMERHRSEPFFVYFPMTLPHPPFVPTPHSEEWKEGDRHKGDKKFYRDMVEYMDTVAGRVVRKIDELRLRERTLILFYSDNGTPQGIESRMGERVVHGGKGLTTDAGTHVPLIANWKGTAPAGKVLNDLVDSTDFLPTLAGVARAKPSSAYTSAYRMDGRSLLPQLRGERGNPRDWVYCWSDPRPGWDKDQFTLEVFARDQRYKLYSDGRLFDVPDAPTEKRPIAPGQAGAEAARARKKLQGVLDRMRSEGARMPS